MSAADDLASMARLFGEATRLNLEAATRLAQGAPLADLAPLFQAKEELSSKLMALLPLLESIRPGMDHGPEFGQAQARQAEAARSEAQLSEILGKLVSQRGKAAGAYQQKGSQSPIKGWDVEG